jgi:hypothetical protein
LIPSIAARIQLRFDVEAVIEQLRDSRVALTAEEKMDKWNEIKVVVAGYIIYIIAFSDTLLFPSPRVNLFIFAVDDRVEVPDIDYRIRDCLLFRLFLHFALLFIYSIMVRPSP